MGWHRSRVSPGAYFGVLLLFPLLTGALRTASRDLAFLGERVDLPGQLAAALMAFVLAAVATPRKRYPTQARWFLLILFSGWAGLMSVSLWHGDDFRREFLVVPLAIGLLLWRPLDSRDLVNAIKIQIAGTALILLVFSVALLDLESLLGSLGPRGTAAPGNWAWAGGWGPFLFGTYMGALGISSLLLRGTWRFAGIALGLVGIYWSNSEGVYLALLVALAILLLTTTFTKNHKLLVALGLIAIVVPLVSYMLLTNPTGSGRTLLWQRFLEVWLEYPVAGTGTSALPVATGPIGEGQIVFTQAHNMFVDALTRFGLIGFLAYTLIFAFAAWAIARSRPYGVAQGLFVFIFVASLLDYTVPLEFWSAGMSFLVLAVLIGTQKSAPIVANAGGSGPSEHRERIP
jgi:hypothetical protein